MVSDTRTDLMCFEVDLSQHCDSSTLMIAATRTAFGVPLHNCVPTKLPRRIAGTAKSDVVAAFKCAECNQVYSDDERDSFAGSAYGPLHQGDGASSAIRRDTATAAPHWLRPDAPLWLTYPTPLCVLVHERLSTQEHFSLRWWNLKYTKFEAEVGAHTPADSGPPSRPAPGADSEVATKAMALPGSVPELTRGGDINIVDAESKGDLGED